MTDTGLRALPIPPGPAGVAAVRSALADALAEPGHAGFVYAGVPAGVQVDSVLRAGLPLERPDIAWVCLTSGSTGDPVGVLLPHAALRSAVAASADRTGGPGGWLAALPVTSAGGLMVVARAVLAGTPLVAGDWVGGAGRFTPQAFVAASEALRSQAAGGRICVSLVPPQVHRLLADPAAAEQLAGYDVVLVGGAAVGDGLAARAAQAGVRLIRTYGMTETCGGCVYDGRPLAGVQVRGDEAGHLEISGPMLAAGYRARPDRTAAAFADGWFRTGDLGSVTPDGEDSTVTVHGRADDTVQVDGINVALGAVEEVLRDQVGVLDVAVVATPDEVHGMRLAAWLVPSCAGALEDEGLVDRLRAAVTKRLGRVAAPRRMDVLDALPLLTSGKIDQVTLRRWSAP